jgi:hypothetical protein
MLVLPRAVAALRLASVANVGAQRNFCSARATLGVSMSASKAEIKQRYYELVLKTHPDVAMQQQQQQQQDGDQSESVDAFLKVQQAFEELMAASTSSASARGAATSQSSAARGGSSDSSTQRRGATASPRPSVRPPTIGEILCRRLEDEPAAYEQIWKDTLERRLAVTTNMTCAIFKACAVSGAGMPAALAIFREAAHAGVLTQEVRTASIVSLLTLCKEQDLDTTFVVVDEITDADRTPEVLAALSSAFSYFPSGASF